MQKAISIATYRSFRRHLINIHKQKIDPRICEHCGHRANARNDLHYHILIEHNIKPPNDFQFPKCGLCTFIALDQPALCKHKEEDHQSQEDMSDNHSASTNNAYNNDDDETGSGGSSGFGGFALSEYNNAAEYLSIVNKVLKREIVVQEIDEEMDYFDGM